MVWTIDLDDFNNVCCRGSYPLLTKVNEAFKRIPMKSSSSSSSSSNSMCDKPNYPTTPAVQIPTTTDEGAEQGLCVCVRVSTRRFEKSFFFFLYRDRW